MSVISKDAYMKIQSYKRHGTSQRETARRLGLDKNTVSRWWDASEPEYDTRSQSQAVYLDQYKEYIIQQIKLCPQIRGTNLYYKLQDAFPDFECLRPAFYRYVKRLREQTGYYQFGNGKNGYREALPPGYEAQVDFGQYKLQDMYGKNLRVYFFCMILSYSNLGFVYFSRDPFTTQTAIRAHDYAFRYFGGRTQTIMYDQDRVFVASENLGNILFVPAFEQYVREIGYSIVLCRPRSPQTKGRVENFVKTVKNSFLDGRTYTGIDSLNSAALAWLDCAADFHRFKQAKYTPRYLFREESKYLIKVQHNEPEKDCTRIVGRENAVEYEYVEYELPKDKVAQGEEVRVREVDGTLLFYKSETNELIHKCLKATGSAMVVRYSGNYAPQDSVAITLFQRMFEEDPTAMEFLRILCEKMPRYKVANITRINTVSRRYAQHQMIEAFGHCVKAQKCTALEVIAWLVYKYGVSQGGLEELPRTLMLQSKSRALELMEEEHD